MRYLTDDKGVSLVELVMTMVLLAIVAYIAINTFSFGAKSYIKTDDRTTALDDGRTALERMTREIRNLKDQSSVTVSSASQFSFTDIYGSAIDFNLAGATITRNGSVLSSGTASLVLEYFRLDGTPDAAFSPGNTKLIRITLESTSGDESITLRSDVYPRNI